MNSPSPSPRRYDLPKNGAILATKAHENLYEDLINVFEIDYNPGTSSKSPPMFHGRTIPFGECLNCILSFLGLCRFSIGPLWVHFPFSIIVSGSFLVRFCLVSGSLLVCFYPVPASFPLCSDLKVEQPRTP